MIEKPGAAAFKQIAALGLMHESRSNAGPQPAEDVRRGVQFLA
jgi:hypothetical protein